MTRLEFDRCNSIFFKWTESTSKYGKSTIYIAIPKCLLGLPSKSSIIYHIHNNIQHSTHSTFDTFDIQHHERRRKDITGENYR